MKITLYRCLKLAFIVSLMTAYLFLMFLPTVRKFLAGVVTVEVRTEAGTLGVPAPAITFCPSNVRDYGWNETGDLMAGQFLTTLCADYDTEDVAECVREKTFPLKTFMKYASRPFATNSLMKESLWSSNMVTTPFGLCHTFKYPGNIGADFYEDSFIFLLSTELNYRIIIHDPLFYHVIFNSLNFPRIWLEYKMKENLKPGHFELLSMSVTQHQLLNRPDHPCEEEEDYDFLQCVKTSQAGMVGCRPPWDSWSPATIPLCHTMEQLQQYEMLDTKALHYHQAQIVEIYGCKVPCNYKEYKAVADPTGGYINPLFSGDAANTSFAFVSTFASTKMRVETEVWAFSAISFIADLGGSLSLFVGVSFLSVWDCIDLVLKYK